jgi:hypothetical protein
MGSACSKHVRCEMCIKFWSENLKGRNHLGDLGLDLRIILQLVLDKWDGKCGLGSSGSG